jgi:hypothetical protein
MHVTRELIEKYHEGNCTPEETKAVENWLFSDEAEEQFMLPEGESKEKIQDEIWNEINLATPTPEKHNAPTFFETNPFWRPAVAAAAIFVVGIALFNIKYPAFNSEVIVLKNASETINKDVNESRYTISLGPKSNIEINNNTGSIDFCGAVMINPKEDIEFTIQGTCANPTEQKETMTLKKGLNYIALNYNSHELDSEMIILEEGALMGLPPLIQRQLMNQFDI